MVGEVPKPSDCLRNQSESRAIPPWSGLTVAGYMRDDQIRTGASEEVRGQSKLVEVAWAKIFDKHIGTRKQPKQERSPFRILQIDGDASLISAMH